MIFEQVSLLLTDLLKLKMQKSFLIILNFLLFLIADNTFSQNPIIRDQYTADPSARVFGDSVFLYPSHDIAGIKGKGRDGWFCMEDYHVFSTANFTDWNDQGVIVHQNKVGWVDSTKYSMWAPDCININGKYYFYFPSLSNDTIFGKGFAIGVAVSETPFGPFIPEPKPVKNVHGIDPNVFINKDGQAYLYWAMKKIYIASLSDNMLEIASEPKVIEGLPESGLKEGPYLFERNGIYYMTYPHVENKIERLEYAVSNNPKGPFKFTGVIMDESPAGCWTNQQSIIDYKGQWYLFYHSNDLSPSFDKNRSVRIDSLFFNRDGTIKKVTPSLRGVGLTLATDRIQIDRYSCKSDTGVAISFLDTLNKFYGWKTILFTKDSWIRYNTVDFGNEKLKFVQIRALSETGGSLQIRLNDINGPVLSELKVDKSLDWKTIDASLLKYQPGIHNLVLKLNDNKPVEIDWIRFLK
jgi:hypothetical protein